MKTVNVYMREKGTGEAFIQQYGWDTDHPKEWFLKFQTNIRDMALRNDPNMDFADIEIEVPNTHFAAGRLEAVGREVASVYGGVCNKIKVYPNHVRFLCKEFDEKFEVVLTYDEIDNNNF